MGDEPVDMPGFSNPFAASDDGLFDRYDAFVPDHLPRPGPFLDGHDLLTDEEHAAFHRLSRALFEERTVYDMTFNYNLARLNLDTRHPNAGYRYARERNDRRILRAEFTPTTPFCPQTHTLTVGSFRAWNGLTDRHEYELIRVRSAPMHHRSEAINEQLDALESAFLETGSIDHPVVDGNGNDVPSDQSTRTEGSRWGPTRPPF